LPHNYTLSLHDALPILEYTTRERARLAPQPMSRKVMGSIEHAATRLGVTYRVMPSGAGHDTQNMARICETGMIFVPSKGGVSHRSEEHTSELQSRVDLV